MEGKGSQLLELKLGTHMDRYFYIFKKNLYTFLKNVRVTKLKPDTNMESSLRYCGNQGQEPITIGVKSRDRFYNLPSMKIFVIDFSGTIKAVKLKLSTHVDNGLMYPIYQNQGWGLITLGVTSLEIFYNLPLMRIFVALFSRTVSVTKLKPGTHMDSGLIYCVYQNLDQWPITHRLKCLGRFYNLP